MQNPFADLVPPDRRAPAPVVIGTPRPKQPPPQTQTQSALDEARLGRIPLENEQTQTSIESNRTSMANSALDNATNIRKQFEAMQPVQDYRAVLPQYSAATRAADNQGGDLQIVYAFGKVMDPPSVVREGEVAMARDTGGIADRVRGYLAGLQGEGRLRPEQRRALLMEIRNRASSIADQYNQIRNEYKGIAERNNLNPLDIVGEHPGAPFQQAEADFVGHPITNLDGSQGAAPRRAPPIDPEGIGDIGFNQPGDALPEGAQEFQRDFVREISEGRVRTAQEIVAYARQRGFNVSMEEADAAAKAIAKGVMPSVATPVFEDANISRERGAGGIGETADAAIRGAADVPTLGMADEIAAAGETIFSGGEYRRNLARQRAIDEYDTENHFPARVAGQVAGGLALPLGEVRSAGQLALKSGGYGAGYGFGSGEGSFGDRSLNALMGAGAGAAGGYALGAGAQLAAKGIGAGARRFMGPPSPRQNALLQAGTEEGVPLNMSDVFPGSRNTVSTLETIPGAAGPVQRGIAAGRDAIESRTQDLARGGTVREDMGEVFQEAGHRFVGDANKQGNRLYERARKAAGDTLIRPRDVSQTLSRLFQQEGEVPGGTKAGAVIQRYVDDFNERRGGITLEGARKMRSELLSSLRTDGGLSKKAATRLTGQIMSAVNSDIERSLTEAGKANAVRFYRQADRFWAQSREEIERVTEKFIGPEDNPKPVEQTLAAIQAAMGPKGNAKGLGGMLRRLTPEERKDFAATIVEPLGRRGTDEPFSPATFIQNARKMSPAARRLVFGADGERSIQNLVRLSNAKKETVQSLNNSRSGMTNNYRTMLSSLFVGLPGGGAMIGMASGLNGSTGAVGGMVIGGTGITISRQIAKALMNESFTRLLANAPATTNAAAINAHIGRMRQLAAKDPNVRAVVQNIEESLLRFANDNVSAASRAAASPDRPDTERK